MPTDAAIVSLGRTGRLVTSAELILFLAFASLASAPDTDVKVRATGLGGGILLDATLVRALSRPRPGVPARSLELVVPKADRPRPACLPAAPPVD